jgi:hypothetical protein
VFHFSRLFDVTFFSFLTPLFFSFLTPLFLKVAKWQSGKAVKNEEFEKMEIG